MQNKINIPKIECGCGGYYQIWNQSHHQHTKKHETYFSIKSTYTNCPCGGNYMTYDKIHHFDTKRHKLCENFIYPFYYKLKCFKNRFNA